MNRSLALLLPAALLGAVGCQDYGFTEGPPTKEPLVDQLNACIDINPRRIQFEPVSIADDDFTPEERVVTISNTCEGTLEIEFRDHTVTINAGEMIVVPRGVEHRPIAREECKIMLLEPRGVVNTGDAGGGLTAENDVWI